jgi:uncharacterized protein (DUF1684 family)
MRTLFPVGLAIFLLAACGKPPSEEKFLRKHQQWQERRMERLSSPGGWLNLAGLYWLAEGENTLGSDSSNHIVFPAAAPGRIGRFILSDSTITFIPEPGVEVMHGNSLAGEMKIRADRPGPATVLEAGSLAWFVIERSGRYGIRLRDYDHPAPAAFGGIESFPPSLEWRIRARFEPYEEAREILVPTEIGTMEQYVCPGTLHFNIGGVEQTLLPLNSGKRLFILFADETSGIETYGGGRFMYTDAANRKGWVILDFNRAYNPPCAFTPYATCPLPPRENFLSVRIEAGEKYGAR